MKKRVFLPFLCMPFFIFLLVMVVAEGVSQAAEKTSMISSNIDSSSIKTEIENIVSENEDRTAAVSIAVFQNEKTLHEGYYGHVNIKEGMANSPEMVMEWGSVSKLLVWVSVMQLVEQGEIDLNNDIAFYLPEGFLSNLKYDQKITMMNLMHHHAGWEDQLIELFVPVGEEVDDLGEALKKTLPKQIYVPGTVVAYSNWGAALAGYIVERVSGMTFSEYVHTYIFDPLGMEHTALLPNLEDNPWVSEQRNLLNCYTTNLTDLGPSRYQIPLYPAGMTTGTMEDLLSFGKALLPSEEDNSPLFMKRETLDQFLTPTLFYNDGNSTPRNAHGLWLDQTDILAFGHSGNTAGSSANLQIDPVSGIGLVVMTNQSNETTYNVGLQEMVFGTYPQPDHNFQETDISGIYSQSRTIKTGGLRLYNFLLTMPFIPGDDHHFYVPMSGMEIFPIGPDRFLLDYGETVGIGYISKNEDDSFTLEVGVQDFLPKKAGVYAFEVSLIVALVFAMIYSLYTIIMTLIRKLRKKPLEPRNGERISVSICNLALFFSFLFVAVNVINFESGSMIRLGFALCAIFSVAICIYLIRMGLLFKKFKKNLLTRRMIFTTLAAMAMLINSLYWQWFNFW